MKKLLRTSLLICTLIFGGCTPQFFKIIPANFAKEVCSCIYVEEQSKSYCQSFGRQMFDVSGYDVNESSNSITAWGFGFTATAIFEGPRLGCRLLPSK